MAHIFEDAGEGLAADPANQALQARANESQRAGCVGIADQTLIFPPASVPLPRAAFARPVGLDHLSHSLMALGLEAPTADKMSGEFFLAGNFRLHRFFLGGRSVARFEK